ncbi:MAG: YIP1 family protein [Desulfobacteraceae bacterium]|jgi:hypothetical protein
MTVEIVCPQCNFSKSIPRERIPAGARWATCPQCKHRFSFAPPKGKVSVEPGEKEAGAEDRVERGVPPWENRSELGLWQGIYQTFKAVLFSPDKLFGTMTHKGSIMEPLAFGLLLGSIGSMFGFFWQFLMMSGSLLPLGEELLGRVSMSLIFFAIIIISPFFVAIIIFIGSAILHLLLIIVRGGKNGFEATFRVVSYSQATQIWGVIPFIGGFIGGLWILIVQIVGLREIHETSYLRVILALLIPIALILLLALAVVIPLLVFGLG